MLPKTLPRSLMTSYLVSLRSTFVPPPLPAIYASLRRLTLFDSFWMSSYAEFLNVLGSCRALEYLSLANKIFHFFEYDLQVLDPAKKHQPLTAPVVLPELRFLKLWGPSAVVFRLLAAIHAPKVAKIRFGSDLDADEDEYGPDVARLLAPNPQKRYPFLSSPTIISIRCWNVARFGVCLRNELTSSDLLYHLERRTGDHSWDPYLTQNLTAVVDIFPVASINTLIVEGSLTGVSANVWKRIFLAFSGLREVYLKGRGTVDSFWLGLERATLASVEDGGAVCCPSLSEITSEGRPSTRYKFAATTGLFDIIRGALGTRAEQGSRPLKKPKLDLFYAKDVWEQTVERRDALVEVVRALVGELEYRALRMDA